MSFHLFIGDLTVGIFSPFIREYKLKEIQRATKGFSTIIESDSHGTVYKAWFPDGLIAAVKEFRASQQGKDAFFMELELLSRMHHLHIIRIRGYSAGHHRFLVFDYMENGSLKEHLHDDVDQRCRHVMFQFGVLILELITGQSLGNDGEELVQWVQKSSFTHSMYEMIDVDLGNGYNERELRSLLALARLCTKNDGKSVISISQVLRYLQRRVIEG
ncbi:putative receptor-like protein kinase [Acorus gramineus]|uniref:Receptor-like protein kinase n=1 Tax=Acorus gramineus TaxID=55184 RepID=A0AAV9B5N8_ACOGR|nr:putative receptor-like protein kinase [Acorus gramineus]